LSCSAIDTSQGKIRISIAHHYYKKQKTKLQSGSAAQLQRLQEML